MKYFLLLAIKLYWFVVPTHKRNKCIYQHSCSKYVYDKTYTHGLIAGFKALNFRMKRCNSYFQIFKNPVTNATEIILSTGDILPEDEISKRLII